MNSLDAFKYAIFESTVSIKQINKGPDFQSLESSLKTIESYGRRGLVLANALPWARNILAGAGPSIFLAVRSQIICIDDLERVGKGLEVKDILGLVSFLKEQRKCKVVLLLNQDELGSAKDDFDNQLEKVVDTKIEFDPTAQEAAEIAVTLGTKYSDLLKNNCVTLGIVNLRVIKKIEKLCERLAENLSDYDPLILKQAVHSATLFGWVHYQRNGIAPTPEFVRGYNSYRYSLGESAKKASDQEKAWHALLREYSFSNIDELDVLVFQGIEAGHFNWSKLKAAATNLQKQIEHTKLDDSFNEAWRAYHDSFSSSAEDVLKGIGDAFYKCVNAISPINLNGTVKLFKELGKPEEVPNLIKYYLENRHENRDFFDLERSPFGSDVSETEVRRAFSDKLATFSDQRNPEEILLEISERRGWNAEDIEALAKLTPENLRDLFKASEGKKLHRLVRAAMQFNNIGNAGEGMKKIASDAIAALQLIGQESSINARRVRGYGIEIADPAKLDEREQH